MVSVEDDDLAGLEDISSEGEDDNYEAELTDGEAESPETASMRKAHRKRTRDEGMEPLPLMAGKGKSFQVLGFNQNQRAVFVQILMRFGVGEFDWADFTPRLKQKSYEEIKDYGFLFLSHIAEDITDSPTFPDGVPKEGLRIQDVLVRIGGLLLIRDKVKFSSERLGTASFSEDIISRLPGLRSGKFWKEEHDILLLRAVLKHGYGRWQAIVDDKDLRIQGLICQEQNLHFVNLPVPKGPQDGSNTFNSEATDVAQGATDTTRLQSNQEYSMLNQFREMQRKQVEFIKKRVILLEKALNAEYQKIYFGDIKSNGMATQEENVINVSDLPSPCSVQIDAQVVNQLPQVNLIGSDVVSTLAFDDRPERLDLVRLYNEMGSALDESVQAYTLNKPIGPKLSKTRGVPFERIYEDINKILCPEKPIRNLVESKIEPHNESMDGYGDCGGN